MISISQLESAKRQAALHNNIFFINDHLNLGSFNGKKKLKGEILVSNQGKSVLDIRSMQMFTMGLQVQLKKSKIQPGETVKMKVTAVAADLKKSRAKHPRILMITNDPENAKVVINSFSRKANSSMF